MERVHFVAPVTGSDLRVVLSNTTHNGGGYHAVVYKTQNGETRTIPWLTAGEAARRAAALRKRGYKAVAGSMD